MAYEIGFGYTSGATLTYGAYRPDGSVRTNAGTALSEVGSTGYYYAGDANLVQGDIIIVKEGASVVLSARYSPLFGASTLGQELVVNGDFSADSDWTKGDGWTIADGKAIGLNAGSGGNLQQALSVVLGKQYVIQFEVSDFASGGFFGPQCYFLGSTMEIIEDGTYSFATNAVDDVLLFTIFTSEPDDTMKIDNVSVKQLITGLSPEAVALVSSIPINTFNSGGGTKLI